MGCDLEEMVMVDTYAGTPGAPEFPGSFALRLHARRFERMRVRVRVLSRVPRRG